MKLTRQQFLRVLPATVLALSGCAASETAPASTEELVFDHACPLDYATQFTADCYEGGYTMLTLTESGEQFLVTPEDAAAVEGLPESVTVLRQPIRNIYLVSTSVMDLFLALDGLDSVTLSGTQAEGWYLDEARAAMEAGRIAYAGKYSAPDYEKILAANCGLAIENTMIYHTPEVKEQLERFGIPVLVERSSYESGPLARLKLAQVRGHPAGERGAGGTGIYPAGGAPCTADRAGFHRQALCLFLHHSQQPCQCAQGRRLCGPDDRDGGR